MRNVRLGRLLAREEVAEIVKSLASGPGTPLAIFNEAGELISGEHDENAQEYPVILDDDVIGVVSGDRRAGAVARLLTYLAGEERDKLDLAREVMKRHREITLFLDYAERLGPNLSPEELRAIVDREAKNLFKNREVSVSLEPGDSGEQGEGAATRASSRAARSFSSSRAQAGSSSS